MSEQQVGADRLKLYILKRKTQVGWDEMGACVVCAKTPKEAREYASKSAGDESSETWRNHELTSCTWLAFARKEVKEGMILEAFNNG